MNSLFDLNFLLNSVLFCIGILAFFFVPGFVFLQKIRFSYSSLATLVLSFGIGMCLWGIQGYIFGYLQIRSYTYVYMLFCVLYAVLFGDELWVFVKHSVSRLKRMDTVLLVLLCIGVFIQSVQMFGSGIQTQEGMSLYRVHGQDGMFHLSLIQSIVASFPPVEPGAVGVPVVNYHYWSDLIIAEVSRTLAIPIPELFFQFFPIFISLLTALALLVFLSLFGQKESVFKKTFSRLSVFFLFAGSDLAYIVMLWLRQVWGFHTSAIDNGATQFLNMPHAMAKFLFFCALFSFVYWTRDKRKIFAITPIVLGAVLFGVKIYFALLFCLIIAVYGICLFIVEIFRKGFQTFRPQSFVMEYIGFCIVLIGFALCIYLPANKNAGGLGYYPLEWPKLFLSQENLDWTTLRYKKAIAEYVHNTPKIVYYDLIAIFVTMLCVHGTRAIGFLPTKKMITFFGKKLTAAFFVSSFIFTFLGLYTLQVSGSFNVFNFFASSLSILAVTTAFVLSQFWESKRIFLKGVVVIIVLLTLPRIIFETHKILYSYQARIDRTLIPSEEIQALTVVANVQEKNCVIQSHPENQYDFASPYVSYFSNCNSYIAGQKVLETHNQPTEIRVKELREIFSYSDPNRFQSALKAKGIVFLYLTKGQLLPVDPSLANMSLLYENSSAQLYRIN